MFVVEKPISVYITIIWMTHLKFKNSIIALKYPLITQTYDFNFDINSNIRL